MNRFLLLDATLIFSPGIRAQGNTNRKPVSSGIDRVTVFLNGAQVNRSARAAIAPGTQQLIFQGITRNDVNIVQGVSITVALAFILINIVVDMLYVLVNPRIRSI